MSPVRTLRRRILRTLPIATVVLASLGAVLVVSACGGGSAGSAATPTSTAVVPVMTPTPAPSRTPTPEPDTTYTVEAGDTAWAIATELGITLAQLAAANGLTEAELEQLQIGQQLRIPREATDP